MNQNLTREVSPVISLAPAARNASANGTSADLAGYESCVVVFPTGTVTDGTHTPKLQESNDNSTWNDVAAGDQSGTLVALTASSVQRVGYIGAKRYLRAVLTVSGATTGALSSALILRGYPHQTPAP